MAVFKGEPWARRFQGQGSSREHGHGCDSELWFRNGNCTVHLYGKGQSRRGPSFKIPFSALVETECYPLIQRFLVIDGPDAPASSNEILSWHRSNPHRKVELYIPPPSPADKGHAFAYHLGTRNFFAWACRRSLVGEYLGSALVELLHSMQEFRSESCDYVADLFDYMDEEGYLDLTGQPDHALGLLHFAEEFQMQDVYTRAFAHCAGMNETLYKSTQYRWTSAESKKLIRAARQDMDSRVYKAADAMRNFLDDDLSDAHMGFPCGTRAHLERFRSFLLSFYTAKFGYYPPAKFGPSVYQTMRSDFEALYYLLVDVGYRSCATMPAVAVGGICTLQLVQSFDTHHQYEPLEHPLPLLPQLGKESRSTGVTRLLRGDRLSPSQRQTAHASLIKASNWDEMVFQNDLVRAYRKFEEDSVLFQNREDRHEKVSLVDARKVRWILVYAIYQVLRSATDAPSETQYEVNVPYHLAVSTEGLPPWKTTGAESQQLVALATETVDEAQSVMSDDGLRTTTDRIEIKPDVDYFALTHKEPHEDYRKARRASMPAELGHDATPPPPLSRSLSHALTRNSTIRRSVMMIKSTLNTAASPVSSPASSPRPMYHEIVVHGYGNGTNHVSLEEPGYLDDDLFFHGGSVASRSDSTGGKSDSNSSSSRRSGPESLVTDGSSEDDPDSVQTPSSTTMSPSQPFRFSLMPEPLRPRRRDVMSMVPALPRSLTLPARSSKRPVYVVPDVSNGANDQILAIREGEKASPGKSHTRTDETQQQFPPWHTLSLSRRTDSKSPELRRRSFLPDSLPLRIHDEVAQQIEAWSAMGSMREATEEQDDEEEDEWTAMQAFMDGGDVNAKPAWEQYADLGGLTEMR